MGGLVHVPLASLAEAINFLCIALFGRKAHVAEFAKRGERLDPYRYWIDSRAFESVRRIKVALAGRIEDLDASAGMREQLRDLCELAEFLEAAFGDGEYPLEHPSFDRALKMLYCIGEFIDASLAPPPPEGIFAPDGFRWNGQELRGLTQQEMEVLEVVAAAYREGRACLIADIEQTCWPATIDSRKWYETLKSRSLNPKLARIGLKLTAKSGYAVLTSFLK